MKTKGAPCCYGRWLIRNGIGREGTPPCGECLACEAVTDDQADDGALSKLKNAELVALAAERGIDVDPKAKKAVLIAALEADDQADDGDDDGDDDGAGDDEPDEDG